MKKYLRSIIESLHFLFSGDPDNNDLIPFQKKLSGVLLYMLIIGAAIALYWLLQQK